MLRSLSLSLPFFYSENYIEAHLRSILGLILGPPVADMNKHYTYCKTMKTINRPWQVGGAICTPHLPGYCRALPGNSPLRPPLRTCICRGLAPPVPGNSTLRPPLRTSTCRGVAARSLANGGCNLHPPLAGVTSFFFCVLNPFLETLNCRGIAARSLAFLFSAC